MKVLVINTVRFKLNGISAVIKNYYQAMDKKNLQMDFVAIDEPSDEYRSFFEESHLRCYVFHKKNIVNYFFYFINHIYRHYFVFLKLISYSVYTIKIRN